MNRVEFSSILKRKLKELLLNGNNKVFFDVDEAPDGIRFGNFIEQDISKRPKYLDNSWYEYDTNEFSIEISPHIPNEIIGLLSNSDFVNRVFTLSPFDFELSCILMLKKFLGNSLKPDLRASRDDGIDFYGKYDARDESESNFFDIPAWYIGQAKYFESNPVQTNLLRELIGTVELAKRKVWSIEGIYNNIDIKGHEHVIPVFITSSRFSNDSYKIAENYGIKLLDIIDLLFWLLVKYEGDLDNFNADLEEIKNASKEVT